MIFHTHKHTHLVDLFTWNLDNAVLFNRTIPNQWGRDHPPISIWKVSFTCQNCSLTHLDSYASNNNWLNEAHGMDTTWMYSNWHSLGITEYLRDWLGEHMPRLRHKIMRDSLYNQAEQNNNREEREEKNTSHIAQRFRHRTIETMEQKHTPPQHTRAHSSEKSIILHHLSTIL